MEGITFVVFGKPVGYKRTTQAGARFDAGYKRYQRYKDAIAASFLSQVPGDWAGTKPLTTVKGEKTRVDIKIYFCDYTHGDPDNILKAILDALFECDKFVCGSFDFFYDKQNPRVEVTIT